MGELGQTRQHLEVSCKGQMWGKMLKGFEVGKCYMRCELLRGLAAMWEKEKSDGEKPVQRLSLGKNGGLD